MAIKSLILATILAIPGSLAINMRSALAIRRPIGRAYFLPASPSTTIVSSEDKDTNGDSIDDLEIVKDPLPRFEFSISTELDGEPIPDLDPDLSSGLFPSAIPSFLFVLDTQETSTRLTDDNGNLLSSTQEQEIIERIIPGIPTTFSDGSLLTRRGTISDITTDIGIFYDFRFFDEGDLDFISFFLPLQSISENLIIDPILATNDISYIVNQNLFGQEKFLENLVFVDASFNLPTIIKGSRPFRRFAQSQAVPEPNNIISLLILGAIGTKILAKYKVTRD